MKNEELDRLFRQKLEQLEGQPSSQAWQQLEQQLQHKSQKKIWFYLSGIAAGLLLLLGIWGSLEYSSSFIPAAPLAQEQEQQKSVDKEEASMLTPAQQPQEPQQKGTIAVHDAPAEKEKQASTQTKEHKDKPLQQAQPARKDNSVKRTVQKAGSPAAEPVELPEAQAKSELIYSLAQTAQQEELPEPATIIEPVIISYKADNSEINSSPAELAATESRELTPKKVFGFLKKVKDNSSGSLAELREAKDELLSLRLSRADFNRAD